MGALRTEWSAAVTSDGIVRMIYAVPDRIEFKGFLHDQIQLTRRLLIRNSSEEPAAIKLLLPNSRYFVLAKHPVNAVTVMPGDSISLVVEFVPPKGRSPPLIHEGLLACSTVGVALVSLWAAPDPATEIPHELSTTVDARPGDDDLAFMIESCPVGSPTPASPVQCGVSASALESPESNSSDQDEDEELRLQERTVREEPPEPSPLGMVSAKDFSWGSNPTIPLPPQSTANNPNKSPRQQHPAVPPQPQRIAVKQHRAVAQAVPVDQPHVQQRRPASSSPRQHTSIECARPLEKAPVRCNTPDSLGSHDSFEDQFLG